MPTTPRVVYGVIPRLFSADGLRGVERRLPHLSDLGVTTVWLSPIFRHSPGDFGYAMTDFTAVDPEHGSEEDLRRLVAAAHELGLEVILDFAPNHTSDEHPHYRDVREAGTASAYADHYVRGGDGEYEHYFDWRNLINLDHRHPAVEQMVIEAMEHWIVSCDIDGYRMDAAWGVRQRTPDFWPRCVRRLRALKPGLFLLAEASARDPYYLESGFDAAYDWTDELGQWAWHSVFSGDRPAATLREALAATPSPGRVLRFLNNNDTGARFATTHGADRYRLALVGLLTLPGVPCLYLGDEVGAAFEPYRQRTPVPWPDDPDLTALHRDLVRLRSDHLGGGDSWTVVDNDHADDCLTYIRPGAAGAPVLCVLNFGPPVPVTVTVDGGVSGDALDLWDGARVSVREGSVRLALAAEAFAVLKLPARA